MNLRGVARFMFLYWLLGVAGGVCFKEGGTDAPHRLFYFICGNVFGIASTWFLMCVYSRMNANLAMVITGAGAFVLIQVVYLALYRTQLTALQWLGIAAVLVGTLMAAWRREPGAAPAPDAESEPA